MGATNWLLGVFFVASMGCYQSTALILDEDRDDTPETPDESTDSTSDAVNTGGTPPGEDYRPGFDDDGDGHDVDVDCNDENPSIHPGASELCNNLDDDCDGLVDENPADAITSYLDGDGDGWGSCTRPYTGCLIPTGYLTECGDCNDSDASVHFHAPEVVGDGIDQDCDGTDGGHLIYVVDRYDGTVKALDRNTGDPVWSLGGLGAMIGIARTDDGTLYVSRYDESTIAEVAPDGSSWRDVLTGLYGPHGLWWDPATRTLLIGGFHDGSVHEFDPATGRHDILVQDLGQPVAAFRFPGDNQVYISNRTLNIVHTYDMIDGTLSEFFESPAVTDTIVPDGTGGLFISCSWDLRMVLHVDLSTRELVSTERPEITSPTGICVDPLGLGIFVSDHDTERIHHLNTSTGELSLFSTAVVTPWQCTSTIPYDADGDGAFTPLSGGSDCDDTDPTTFPGAVDIQGDGLDKDCNGVDG